MNGFRFKQQTLLLGLLLAGALASQTSFGATIYARGDGDWDETSKWSTAGVGGASCSCIPGATDDVIIDGYKIDVDAGTGNVSAASLLVTNASDDDGRIKVEAGAKLTITGD